MEPVGNTSYFPKLSNLTALFYGLTKVDPEMLTLAEDPVPWKMRVDPCQCRFVRIMRYAWLDM